MSLNPPLVTTDADPASAKVFSHNDLYVAGCGMWLGYTMQKSPLDMFVFHQILYDCRPDILVETGTWHGASALFYATTMDALNHGVVITIDNWEFAARPKHPRVFYIAKSSVEEETIKIVQSWTCQVPRVMVTLDSDHSGEHVYKELEAYGPMVTLGQYLVVEDSNIHGHPIKPNWSPTGGPWEAVHDWLPKHPEFAIDKNIEPLYSNNPDGWLRRVK